MKRAGDAVAPPPKKACGSQQVTPSAMTLTMLQRQNVNLQNSLHGMRRKAEVAEAQLATATATLTTRDNALSTYERQWRQMEEQLALMVRRCSLLRALNARARPS